MVLIAERCLRQLKHLSLDYMIHDTSQRGMVAIFTSTSTAGDDRNREESSLAPERTTTPPPLATELFYFLSDTHIQTSLIQYQYAGQDLSLLYKYVLSPLATFCVTYGTPKSVAPNVITFTGLLFMICAYCIMWYHAPLLFAPTDNDAHDDILPRYVFLCNAVAILLYQTLDNMDGKQARRISASSPLGLFFDHGCDAINSVFGSANWIIALGLSTNDSIHAFVMLMGPYALFYFSTWEEYYTGELIMPIVNGPNEGLFGAVAVSLISYYYGPSYWHQHDWWESICTVLPFIREYMKTLGLEHVRNCDFFICITAVCMIQEIVIKTVFIVHRYGVGTISNLVPFVTLAACTMIVSFCYQTIWIEMPRTCLHLSSILFVEMTTDLMLKHMTKQRFEPIRLISMPLVVFTALIALKVWPRTYISIDQFVVMYTSIAGTYLVTRSVILINEMCIVLNIWCFTVGQRNPKNSDAKSKVEHSNGLKSD